MTTARVLGTRRRLGGVVLVAALVAAGCSSGGSDAESTTTTSTKSGASTTISKAGESTTTSAVRPVAVKDCWWPVAGLPATVTVTCGTIDVPANHDDASSKLISLAYARVHDSRAKTNAPPVVMLHGGPGGSELDEAPTADGVSLASLAERDLILYDQRGTGRSTPSLNCPEVEQATLADLDRDGTWAQEFGATEAAAKTCRARLVGEGIDLADYDTPASVADLETIRQAFGIDTWNVAGRSYGTRLGLAYARAHADRVRSFLLDSVYAPNVSSPKRNLALPEQAIAKLTEACDAQPACLAANGHVDEQLTKAIADFDARPESSDATIVVDGKSITRHFTLTGSDLAGGLFAAQYRSDFVPLLPSIIAALARGDRSIVPTFLSTGVPNLLSMSEGVFYSFECADSGRTYGPKGFQQMRKDPGRNALYALGTAEPYCAAWKVPYVPAAFQQPVTVDVATLVVGGTLDPITPFAESKAQAERMPNAKFLAVPGAGHGDVTNDECTRSARDGFWDDPTAALPTCVTSLKAPAFAT